MGTMNFYSHRIARLHDAQMDMIEGLNQLTDLTNPSHCRIEEMAMFSKAIKDLQKAICMIHEVEDDEEEDMLERANMRCDMKMAKEQAQAHLSPHTDHTATK